MTREASDRASVTRKRALRRLAHQENAAYRALFEGFRAAGFSADPARSRAWTQLRQEFPDEYLTFYAIEQVSPDALVPARVRSRAWQRAMGLLTELRGIPYRHYFDGFRATGLSSAEATYRAAAEIKAQEPELFARLLADEIRMWLNSDDTGGRPPAAPAGGSATDFYAALDELTAAVARAARDPRFDAGNVYPALAARVRGIIGEAGLS